MSLNHNSLIEDKTEGTLINIQSMLLFLQKLHANLAVGEMLSSSSFHHGELLILKCSYDALVYEIDRLESSHSGKEKTAIFEA